MKKGLVAILCWGALAVAGRPSLASQTTGEKKQALANVRRVLALPAFFGTPTLLGERPDDKGKRRPPPKLSEERRKRLETYREYLQSLEKKAKTLLPQRLAKRTLWEVLSDKETEEALKALEFAPSQLFENQGYLRGSKFPLADKENVLKIAKQANADALLLTVLDEPLKFSGGVASDGVNLFYESPHVRLKGNFIVVLANGKTIISETMTVVHPYTKRGKREYLLADWEEAEEKLFENFMDELSRYIPPRL